jgi:F-type H+-transporting ATPase subunit b
METLRADYEQRLTSIEAEAREKIQGAIKDAQAARDQIVLEANTRSREMITRAEQEIQHERDQALITLRQQVVDLALGATTKVIGDSLDESRQRRLIDDFIATQTSVTTNGVASGAAPMRSAVVGNGAQAARGDA